MKKLFFLIPFLTVTLFARDLSIKDKVEIFDDFTDGLNTQSDPSKLSKKASPNITNVLIDEKVGSLVERKGFIVSGTTITLTKIVTEFPFVKDNGDRELLISDSSRTFSTRDFTNYVVVKNTQTTSAVLRCAQGRLKAWCTNGVDSVFTWDGTNAVALDGNNGTPNVPRGKFIAFYLDRFWIAATTASNSALSFSALSSTDGFALAPDDARSWPGTNQLNIALGDGFSISGLDVFKGQLQVHKYNSAIFTIFGTDEFSFFARKTNASAGTVSNDSISQLDNLEYYFAKDGVYAFDGSDSQRISDVILPDVMAIVTNLSNIVANRWNTQSEFLAGGLAVFSGSSITVGGLVQPLTNNVLNIATYTTSDLRNGIAPGFSFFGTGGSTGTPFISLSGLPSYNSGNKYTGYISSIGAQIVCQLVGSTTAVLTIRDLTTGVSISTTSNPNASCAGAEAGRFTLFTFNSPLFFKTENIANGNIVYKIDVDTIGWQNNSEVFIGSISVGGAADLAISNATGSYVSEIATISASISFWDLFNAAYNSNGGVVNFFIKGGTAPIGAISTEAFTAIIPGSLIQLPVAKRFVVFAATIAGSDLSNITSLDSVEINHNEGSSNDSRPFAWTWLGRYWLAATTGSASTLIYVKTKSTNPNPNAWTKFTGINVKSFARFGDNFQAGSSTAGAVFRLDFGTNDNGAAIPFVYETPDWHIDGRNFFEKNIFEYEIDANKTSGATLSIGTSVNGVAFTTDTISLNGSGSLNTYLIPNPAYTYKGKTFRFRFSNSELDKPITFNSFGVIYQGSDVR